MSTAADRVAAYLEERAAVTSTPVVASAALYPKRETQLLRLEDLQEVVAIAQDLAKAERAIKAAAWDEAIDWAWEEGQPDHHPDNPYSD